MVPAIILAAGESKRMGEPKALVHFGEKSFLETIVANFRDAGLEKLVVVLGHDARRILKKVQHLPVQFVINHNYPSGQFSSLQCGLKLLPPDVDGVFLALVDQPHISPQLIASLKDVFLTNPQKIVIPIFSGRRGHPVILPRTLFAEMVSAPSSQNAAAIIRGHAEIIHEAAADESILWNINTKEELAAVRRRCGI